MTASGGAAGTCGPRGGHESGAGRAAEEGQTPPAQNDLLTAVSPPSPGLPPLPSAHLLADGTSLLAELTVSEPEEPHGFSVGWSVNQSQVWCGGNTNSRAACVLPPGGA